MVLAGDRRPWWGWPAAGGRVLASRTGSDRTGHRSWRSAAPRYADARVSLLECFTDGAGPRPCRSSRDIGTVVRVLLSTVARGHHGIARRTLQAAAMTTAADRTYRRAGGVITRRIAGETVIVPMPGTQASARETRFFVLNGTAERLWELLAAPQTPEAMAHHLTYEFAVD